MQPCLFSISYAGLWGQAHLSLSEFLRKAHELGFEGVMLAGKRPHLSPLDFPEEELYPLRAALEETGLRCPVAAAYIDLGAPTAGEVPILEMQIAYVQALCRAGSSLGAKVVRVFTAYENPAVPLNSLWARNVTVLREMADRARAWNMTLAIQNHHDLAVHTGALLELLADIDRPNCKLGFDAWSPALRGEDLYEAARQAAPHTAITTNADYVRLPRFRYCPEQVNYQAVAPDLVRAVPFGTGFINYPAFFRGLEDGGFEGPAIYEMCSPIRGGGSLENLDRYARTYLEWLQRRKTSTSA